MKTLPRRLLAALAANLVWLGASVVAGQAAGPQTIVFSHGPGTCGSTMTGGTAWPSACQPVVTIEDATTLSPIDSSDSITLSITPPNTPSGTLVCSSGLTRNASNGVVDFNGCLIDKTGTYSLTATDNTTPGSAATATFSIVAGPPAQFAVTGLANPSTAKVVQTVTVAA